MIKGIGCDIVEHQRINLKIAEKVLSSNELELFAISNNKVEYLASRFAAKEAIIKATNKKYLIGDIEISNSDSGMPISNIPGIILSISHEKNYSVAVAYWGSNE